MWNLSSDISGICAGSPEGSPTCAGILGTSVEGSTFPHVAGITLLDSSMGDAGSGLFAAGACGAGVLHFLTFGFGVDV